MHLSPRRLEVLQMLAEGRGTKEIAAEFGLSFNTARGHIQAILVALGVNSRTQAIFEARRRGLIVDRASPAARQLDAVRRLLASDLPSDELVAALRTVVGLDER